jgi:phosphoribulokinase
MRHPPVVLGIVGKPVAERRALAAGISHLLGGAQRVSRLSLDDYRKYGHEDGLKQSVTAAHPAAIRLDILEQHLGLLRRGEAVIRPTFNRHEDAFEPAVYIEPRPFVIVDGELGFFTQGVRNSLDLRVFYSSDDAVVDWPSDLTEDAVAYVESQRKWADMVVEDLPSAGASEGGAIALTLRPTLPHLALQELIQAAGEQQGMRLELARDMGLPVDRVLIDKAISNKAAAYFKKQLLAAMPIEYRHESAVLGVDSDAQVDSESLALAQMLVVLHLLKVASG